MSKHLCLVAKNLYYVYRYRARKQALSFKLSVEDFLFLIIQPCHYCNKKYTRRKYYRHGRVYTAHYNGVDRKSSKRGYTPKNVLTACKVCNRMKHDMDYRDFLKQVDKIHITGGT